MRTIRSAAYVTLALTLFLASGKAFAQSAPATGTGPATTAAPNAPATGTAPATTTSPDAPTTAAAPATTAADQVAPAPLPAPAPVDLSGEPPAIPPKIQMVFKDQPLDVILTDLSERLGLVVIKQSSMADVRVTIIARQALGVEDITEVLNSALNVKGYAAIRSGLNGRVLKIVTLDDAKKLNVPVHKGTQPELIPTTDEVITQVMPLKFVDAVRLRQDLTPLISSSASIASNAAGNALIVTDTSANVHRIAEIVSALDSQMAAATEIRVYTLKYADATSAAKLINDLFATTPTGGGGGGAGALLRNLTRFTMGGRGGGGGGAPGASPTDQGTAFQPPSVKVSADIRTNTIVVTGPSETLLVVDGIIKSLESNTIEDQGVFVYALKNGVAADIAPVLNNIFGTSTSTSTTTIGTRSAAPGGGGGATSSLTTTGTSGLYGQVYVVPNADTNSLLIMTMPKNFDQVKAIIKTLDRAIPQVLIRVLIAEITHDDTTDLGADFSFLNLTSEAGRGGQLSSNLAELPVPAAGGLVYRALEKDFSATIRALETVGKLDVLSRPYLLASDNQKANFQDVVQYPFASGSRTDVNGNVDTSVTWQTLGISLNVTPHINPEGTVTMLINPEIDTLTGQVVQIVPPTAATSTTVATPGLSEQVWGKRLATTQVAVRNGQTIVIGGMIQDKKTDTINKVPLLGDIPLIGYLFRHTVTDKTKTEVLIFLTPLVAMDAEALKAISKQEELNAGKELHDAVEPGAYQSHRAAMGVQVPTEPPPAAPMQILPPQAQPSQTPAAETPAK